MTRQLALEGAPLGIRVNSISPGPIATPATQDALATDAKFKRHLDGWPLLGRGGEAEDVAYAALCLASDESAWITGINLPIDGGMSSKTGITEHL